MKRGVLIVLSLIALFSSFRIWESLRHRVREPDSLRIRIVDLSGKPRSNTRLSFAEWGWRYWVPLPYTGKPSPRHTWTLTTNADGEVSVHWRDDFLEIHDLDQNGLKLPWAFQTYFKADGSTIPQKSASGFGGAVAQYHGNNYNKIEYATAPELKWNDQR